MIKNIKTILFVTYLFFPNPLLSMMGDGEYKELQKAIKFQTLSNLDEEFWKNLENQKPNNKKTKTAIKKIFDPGENFGASEEVELSEMAKWEIVLHFDNVQEKKLNARIDLPEKKGVIKKSYDTKYKYAGDGDPSPEKIKFKNTNFQISLNYDGNEKTKQPGNCYFSAEGSKPLNYNNSLVKDLDDPEIEILLLLEISRRHAKDLKRKDSKELENGNDEYKDLPVSISLAMVNRLIKDNLLVKDSFWKKTGLYHPYSGNKEQRENACLNIYNLYKEKYMLNFNEEEEYNELKRLIDEYFEIDNNDTTQNLEKFFNDFDDMNI